MQDVYRISVVSEQKCLQREQKCLAEFCRATDTVIIWFSDEIFLVQSVANSPNDRIYEAYIIDVQEGMRLHLVTRSRLGG